MNPISELLFGPVTLPPATPEPGAGGGDPRAFSLSLQSARAGQHPREGMPDATPESAPDGALPAPAGFVSDASLDPKAPLTGAPVIPGTRLEDRLDGVSPASPGLVSGAAPDAAPAPVAASEPAATGKALPLQPPDAGNRLPVLPAWRAAQTRHESVRPASALPAAEMRPSGQAWHAAAAGGGVIDTAPDGSPAAAEADPVAPEALRRERRAPRSSPAEAAITPRTLAPGQTSTSAQTVAAARTSAATPAPAAPPPAAPLTSSPASAGAAPAAPATTGPTMAPDLSGAQTAGQKTVLSGGAGEAEPADAGTAARAPGNSEQRSIPRILERLADARVEAPVQPQRDPIQQQAVAAPPSARPDAMSASDGVIRGVRLDRRAVLEASERERRRGEAAGTASDGTDRTVAARAESAEARPHAGAPRPVVPMVATRDLSALAERIEMMIHRRAGMANVKLKLGELGEVGISVRMESKQAHVHFVVHEPAAREALEAQLPRLRTLLADGGIDLGDVDMNLPGRSEGDSETPHRDARSPDGMSTGPEVGARDATEIRRRGPGGHLLDAFA